MNTEEKSIFDLPPAERLERIIKMTASAAERQAANPFNRAKTFTLGSTGGVVPERKKLDNPEGRVQSAILEYLALRKIWAWRTNRSGMPIRDKSGKVMGLKKSTLPEGHSDIAGILPGTGRALFIEVKAPGKKPTPEQQRFIAKVNERGGVAFWADSLDTVIEKLRPEKLSTV